MTEHPDTINQSEIDHLRFLNTTLQDKVHEVNEQLKKLNTNQLDGMMDERVIIGGYRDRQERLTRQLRDRDIRINNLQRRYRKAISTIRVQRQAFPIVKLGTRMLEL